MGEQIKGMKIKVNLVRVLILNLMDSTIETMFFPCEQSAMCFFLSYCEEKNYNFYRNEHGYTTTSEANEIIQITK